MKPDLLLLSGLLSDETVWADVAARLSAAAQVRIITFPQYASLAAMAQHALRGAPRRFAVAGHSMGGRVALELWRLAPARIAGLALLNTGASPCGAAEPESRGRLVRLARERGMAALAADWLPPMLAAPPARRPQVVARLVAMIERQTAESFAAQQQALLERPDAEMLLPTIRVPTVLLSASEDAWSPPSQHETMRRAIAHSTLIVVADAGHMAPIEQPDAVAEALREWLAGI